MTFAEMKKAREAIQSAYNLDSAAAGRVLSYYNGGAGGINTAVMDQLAAGDLSPVPGILSALGLSAPGAPSNDPQAVAASPSVSSPAAAPLSDLPPVGSSAAVAPSVGAPPVQMASAADGDILPADIAADDLHALPPGLYDDICATIDYYCDNHNISDRQKIHPLQWRSVCMSIGSGIKSRKILYDFDYIKAHGMRKYDETKVLALLFLYDRICSEFRQVAFMHNFPPFAGVSREYFNNYSQRDLTSSLVGLREKAYDMQRSSLVGAVTGGGSATVGNIFLSKALAGLQETVTIQHVSGSAAPDVGSLPDFGSVSALPG